LRRTDSWTRTAELPTWANGSPIDGHDTPPGKDGARALGEKKKFFSLKEPLEFAPALKRDPYIFTRLAAMGAWARGIENHVQPESLVDDVPLRVVGEFDVPAHALTGLDYVDVAFAAEVVFWWDRD
jgi:hypothetical protein